MSVKPSMKQLIAIGLIPTAAAIFPQLTLAEETEEAQKAEYSPYARMWMSINYDDDAKKAQLGDFSPRLGVKATKPLRNGMTGIGRIEYSFAAVKAKESSGTDIFQKEGDGFSDGDDLNLRLGYMGLETDIGTFTFGKQWSSYVNVAGMTDLLSGDGARGTGTYINGDGGEVGTGRADRAIQYNVTLGNVAISVQHQNESESAFDPDVSYKSTNGLSVIYSQDTWGVGVGANIARVDGETLVEATSNEDENIDGFDQLGSMSNNTSSAYVVGGYYDTGVWKIAATAYTSKNHEYTAMGNEEIEVEVRDDNGALVQAYADIPEVIGFYDAEGIELYAHYTINDDWQVYGGHNQLESKEDDETISVRAETYRRDDRTEIGPRVVGYNMDYDDVSVNMQALGVRYAFTEGFADHAYLEFVSNQEGDKTNKVSLGVFYHL